MIYQCLDQIINKGIRKIMKSNKIIAPKHLVFALVVRPTQCFLEWAQKVPVHCPELTLEELNEDPSIYLFSPCESHQQCEEMLGECWRAIFEYELSSWHQDCKDWPQELSFKEFHKWFSTEILSTVNKIY